MAAGDGLRVPLSICAVLAPNPLSMQIQEIKVETFGFSLIAREAHGPIHLRAIAPLNMALSVLDIPRARLTRRGQKEMSGGIGDALSHLPHSAKAQRG